MPEDPAGNRVSRPATSSGNLPGPGPVDGRGRIENGRRHHVPAPCGPAQRVLVPSAAPAWSTTCYKHVRYRLRVGGRGRDGRARHADHRHWPWTANRCAVQD